VMAAEMTHRFDLLRPERQAALAKLAAK
jgi:hypothetical protein